MAKRKTLPKDFEQLVQTASDEDIKKVKLYRLWDLL